MKFIRNFENFEKIHSKSLAFYLQVIFPREHVCLKLKHLMSLILDVLFSLFFSDEIKIGCNGKVTEASTKLLEGEN